MEEIKKNYWKIFWKGIGSFISILWNAVAEKGKFTTALGLSIIVTAVLDPLIKHNEGVVFEQDYMFQILYFVLCGIILIILPSELSISKDGFIVKD